MVIRIGSAKCRCPVAASSRSALTLRNRSRTRREPFSLFLSSASSALRTPPRAGARQESRRSRRPPFGSAFPKVLKTSTQFAAAQSDDGVGTANGPMHPGPFEPGSDGHFASGLHNASGSTQALGVELRVAHAVSVGLEIVQATAGFFGVSHMAANRGEECLEPSGVEFLLPSFRPLGSSRVGRAIKSFAEVTQVLLGVKAVDDLGRSGEQLLHLVPDPGSPIPERRRTLGLAEAAALGSSRNAPSTLWNCLARRPAKRALPPQRQGTRGPCSSEGSALSRCSIARAASRSVRLRRATSQASIPNSATASRPRSASTSWTTSASNAVWSPLFGRLRRPPPDLRVGHRPIARRPPRRPPLGVGSVARPPPGGAPVRLAQQR